MAQLLLSGEEKHFIVSGIEQDFRCDGRGITDFRAISVETGVVSNTNGSSQVKLAGTNVLIGVKASLGETLPQAPNQGHLEFFVDCSANASPIFEGRGGDDLASELSNGLARTFCNGTIDLRSLCVIPGQSCWTLYIDALVLECDGNLFDVLSVAIQAALHDTRLPKLHIIGEGSERDIELSDDPYDVVQLELANVPVLVTLNKIGNRFVVDATAKEEACSDAQILVSVNRQGSICSMQKHGSGGINPELMFEMLDAGKIVGGEIIDRLSEVLARADANPEAPKVGFYK